MNDGDFTIEVLDRVVNKQYNELIFDKKRDDIPQAFILGGQSGAGKTGLQDIMKAQCEYNLIVINGDEFRPLHPDYAELQRKYGKDSVDFTNEFSGKVTEALVSRLRAEKYNVLVEGTLRTAEVPLATCKGFKENGYNVTLALVAVKPQISYLSTILRYEKQLAAGKLPRATAKDKHDYIVDQIPSNLREIYGSKQFDNIVIYSREGVCLYDMSKNPATTPDKIMEEVFTGKWSQKELEQFIAIGNVTQQLMEQRNAAELPDFKVKVFNKDIISAIARKNGLSYGADYIRIVSEDELKKLQKAAADEKSCIKFSVSRKDGKIAVRYQAELKDKVNEILRSKPKSMKL